MSVIAVTLSYRMQRTRNFVRYLHLQYLIDKRERATFREADVEEYGRRG